MKWQSNPRCRNVNDIIFLKLIGRFHLFDIIKLSKLNIAAKKTRKNWFLSIRKRFTAENSSHRRKIIPSEIAQSPQVHQNTVIQQFKVIKKKWSRVDLRFFYLIVKPRASRAFTSFLMIRLAAEFELDLATLTQYTQDNKDYTICFLAILGKWELGSF